MSQACVACTLRSLAYHMTWQHHLIRLSSHPIEFLAPSTTRTTQINRIEIWALKGPALKTSPGLVVRAICAHLLGDDIRGFLSHQCGLIKTARYIAVFQKLIHISKMKIFWSVFILIQLLLLVVLFNLSKEFRLRTHAIYPPGYREIFGQLLSLRYLQLRTMQMQHGFSHFLSDLVLAKFQMCKNKTCKCEKGRVESDNWNRAGLQLQLSITNFPSIRLCISGLIR